MQGIIRQSQKKQHNYKVKEFYSWKIVSCKRPRTNNWKEATHKTLNGFRKCKFVIMNFYTR